MTIRSLEGRKGRFYREELTRYLRVLGASLLPLASALAFDLHPQLVALTVLPITLGSLIMILTIALDLQTKRRDDSPRCVRLWKS